MHRKLVHEPGERTARVAENIRAATLTFEPLADTANDAVRGEVHAAPRGRRLRPQHELMRAGVVGDELFRAHLGKSQRNASLGTSMARCKPATELSSPSVA